MAIYKNSVFNGGTVQLDGNTFEGCKFSATRLVYSGGEPPIISRCEFVGEEFVFEGAARNTLQFLIGMSKPASGMQQLIRGTFAEAFGKDV